jgi:hypothetical protein
MGPGFEFLNLLIGAVDRLDVHLRLLQKFQQSRSCILTVPGTKLELKLARGSQQEDLDRPCIGQWQEHATAILQTSRVRVSPGVVDCAMS